MYLGNFWTRKPQEQQTIRQQVKLKKAMDDIDETEEYEDNWLDLDPELNKALTKLQRENGMRTQRDFK